MCFKFYEVHLFLTMFIFINVIVFVYYLNLIIILFLSSYHGASYLKKDIYLSVVT